MFDLFVVKGDGEIILGDRVSIGNNVQIVFGSPGKVWIGDNVTIGDNVKFVVESGCVNIGDWTTLHANTLVLCKSGVSLGQHCWFGQNCILDGTGGLTIKNGVRVGMYSQIWTHVAAGELIEGCTLFAEKPVTIERDAWLVGSCTVSSGLHIGEKAICMNGSNITKSVEPNTVVMGAPAKPRDKLSFYKNISLDEKYGLMIDWSYLFIEDNIGYNVFIEDKFIKIISKESELLIFKTDFEYQKYQCKVSQVKFCVENKEYSKRQTDLEVKYVKYLSGHKARFYPKSDKE